MRTDRATHIGLGHGEGSSPRAAARADASSSDIIPHAGVGHVQVRSAPVSEAPPTQPKPRGMEPAIPEGRGSNAARVRPRPNLERRPVDDEVTMQRDLSSLHAQIAATTPGLYDDLDEETSVIQKEGMRLAAARAEEEARGAAGMDEPRASSRSPEVSGSHEVGGSTDVADETPTENPLRVPDELWAPNAKVSVRAASLPALRVAVLGTSIAGEVRLVALASGSQAPTGAAAAILVPLTEEDAECIAKLFETSP